MDLNKICSQEVKNDAQKQVDLLENFDKSLEKACFSYFEYSYVVTTLLYYEEDNSVKEQLQTKFVKNNKKFREFCEHYEPYIKFNKMLVKLKECNESFEIQYNYNKNHEFINKSELEQIVVKNKERSDRTLSLQHIYFVHQSYFLVLETVKYIINNKENNECVIDEFKDKLSLLKGLIKEKKIGLRLFTLNLIRKELHFECAKFYKSSFTQVVIKRQTTFIYDEAKTKIDDVCSICLEDFEKGNSVTKLKCNHYFCTNCIAKWFSSSAMCPTCRRKYYLV